MGFLANIAGGLAQSGLDRHQTDLIRKMEQERFARQQAAQIAAEQRAAQREKESQAKHFKQTLAIESVKSGQVSDKEIFDIGSQLDPEQAAALQSYGDSQQRLAKNNKINEMMNIQTVSEFDIRKGDLLNFAASAGEDLSPSEITSLDRDWETP